MAVIVKEGQLAAFFKRVNHIDSPTKPDKASDLSMLRLNKSGKFGGVVTERVNKLVIPLSESRQTRVKFKSLGDNVGLILPKAKVKDAFATLKIIKKHNGELEVKVACQVSESKSTEGQKLANQILKKASLTINSNSSMQKIEGHDALENKNPKHTPYPKTFSGYYKKKVRSPYYSSPITTSALNKPKLENNSQLSEQVSESTERVLQSRKKPTNQNSSKCDAKVRNPSTNALEAITSHSSREKKLKQSRRNACAQQFAQLTEIRRAPLMQESAYFSNEALNSGKFGTLPLVEIARFAKHLELRFLALSEQVNSIIGNKHQPAAAKALAIRFLIIQATTFGYIFPESRIKLPALANSNDKTDSLYSIPELCQAHSQFLQQATPNHNNAQPVIRLDSLSAPEKRWLKTLEAETENTRINDYETHCLSSMLGTCHPFRGDFGELSTFLAKALTDHICRTLGADDQGLKYIRLSDNNVYDSERANERLRIFMEHLFSKDAKQQLGWVGLHKGSHKLAQDMLKAAQDTLGALPFTTTATNNAAGNNAASNNSFWADTETKNLLKNPEMAYLLLHKVQNKDNTAHPVDPTQCLLTRLLNTLPRFDQTSLLIPVDKNASFTPKLAVLDEILDGHIADDHGPDVKRDSSFAAGLLWDTIEEYTDIINISRPIQLMAKDGEHAFARSQTDTACFTHYGDVTSAQNTRVSGILQDNTDPSHLSATTQVSSNPKTPLHANLVTTHWGGLIASQRPPNTAQGQRQWWSMIADQEVGLIVDLRSYADITTSLGDKNALTNQVKRGQVLGSHYNQSNGVNYIAPFEAQSSAAKNNNQAYSVGDITLLTDDNQEQILGEDLIQTQHKIHLTGKQPTQHTVERLHFLGWPDKTALTPSALLDLAHVIRARQDSLSHAKQLPQPVNTLIHCNAGIGRTGTVGTLLDVMAAIDEAKADDIDGHWLANTIVQAALRGRYDRSDKYIQKPEQFRAVFDAAFTYAAKRIINGSANRI